MRPVLAAVAAALVLSGCYVYRAPTTTAPILAARVLPRADALADLDSLVAIVTEVHPSPGDRLSGRRDSLAGAWPDTVARARLARDANRLLAALGDGHTGLHRDGLEREDALAQGGRVWPFAVQRSADGIIVSAVIGGDTAVLRPGDQLEAVAGRPIAGLVADLGRAVPAELEAYRDRRVLVSLGAGLWDDGIRPPGEVIVTGPDGLRRTVSLRGASREDVTASRAASPVPLAPLTVRRTTDSVLVLDFRRMWGDRATFTARLDSAFAPEAHAGIRAVVVDLRQNGGGDSGWGTQLLSYVTDVPLSDGVRKEWKASRRYRAWFASGVTPLVRPWLPFSWFDGQLGGLFRGPDGSVAVRAFTPERPPANPRRLARPVCILIGPRTFSSAMLLANTARRSGVATLIGEPTGEPPNSHGEVMGFHLPRSGLGGQVSSALFVLDEDPAGDRRGVLPHLDVRRTRDDIQAGRDPAMTRALACGRG